MATATVRQTLAVSGTADPVNQGTADFQVAGTVSGVNVTVGQQVTAGQTLASLDTTTLAQNVSSAQSTLTSAIGGRGQIVAVIVPQHEHNDQQQQIVFNTGTDVHANGGNAGCRDLG